MSEPEQMASAVSRWQKYWWAEGWAGARPRFIATITEIIASVGLLLGLGIIFLVLRLLIVVAGVPAEDIKFFERVDLWAVKAVSVAFSLAFVIQLGIGAIIYVLKDSIKGKS